MNIDAAEFAHTPVSIEGVILYQPPKSLRLRFLNRIRRLLGRDEQDEIIAYLAPGDDGQLVLRWSRDGTFTLGGTD